MAWPEYETTEWDEMHFLQGIAGTLELFHRSTLSFQKVVYEVTTQPVAVFQRIDQAGYKLPIDERILQDTDTLMVFGLDHSSFGAGGGTRRNRRHSGVDETRRDLPDDWPASRCGIHKDTNQRQLEYAHHGDALVPRQQRFGQYTRSLMKALGVPVMNQFGLRPALVKGSKQISPLTINRDLDKLGLLNGVTTFNFHPHLPHYALTTDDTKSVHVLTRQPIDLDRPHPFHAAGNAEFNSLHLDAP